MELKKREDFKMLKEQMEDALKVSFMNLSIIVIIMIMVNMMMMMMMMMIVIVIILVYGPLYSVAFTFETVPFQKISIF